MYKTPGVLSSVNGKSMTISYSKCPVGMNIT